MNRAFAGQLIIGIALLVLALAFLPFTDGRWAWNTDPVRVAWALGSAVTFTIAWITGARMRRKRQLARPPVQPGETVLPVFHASQTGYAQFLAEQTAQALSQAGVSARAQALESTDADLLARLPVALFIASTSGEGDPPDSVAGFVRHVLASDAALGHLRYGVLALGDRHYEHFCGFGRKLDDWLARQGATALFPRIDVDNADAAALETWRTALAALTGSGAALEAWRTPAFADWTLAHRIELNPGSQGEPVFHLELLPLEGPMPAWRAGDIAEIQPRHAAATIARWLAETGLDGNIRIGEEILAQRLSRSELPEPMHVIGCDEQQLASRLTELHTRDYSIASLPADGHLDLLIRQGRRADGSLGLAAGWLTQHTALGGSIRLRLRANPNFRVPDDEVPVILIGNGTGLAGLRALLHERIAQGHRRNWLVFGERQRHHDFHYGAELEAALAQGWIERLDLAFSRDTPQRIYVQQRLLEQADRLVAWVQAGAVVFVCGSQEGMAGAVDAALRQILGDAGVQELIETRRYRRDVY